MMIQFEFLDGTANRQTIIHTNKQPQFEGAEKEIVTPISSENGLRRRAWVEDNRRLVDKLSDGKLDMSGCPILEARVLCLLIDTSLHSKTKRVL